MDQNNFFDVRKLFNLIPLTILLTFCAGASFAQNNLKPGSPFSISDKKVEKTILERPRLVSAKEEKSNSITPSEIEFSTELEQKAFKILNNIRVENGLAPLNWSADMAKVARLHSGNMAKYKFFSHFGQDGLMVNDRADSFGIYQWEALGENIAFNRGFDSPAEKACDGWMKSTGHRENILNKLWKDSAIGVAIADDGTYYFTQVFMVK